MQKIKDLEKGEGIEGLPASLSYGTARPKLAALRSLSRINGLSTSTLSAAKDRPVTQESDNTIVDQLSMQASKDLETGNEIEGRRADLSYVTARPHIGSSRPSSRANL